MDETSKPELEIEKAARGGDPLARFMLGGLRAQKAVDEITSPAPPREEEADRG